MGRGRDRRRRTATRCEHDARQVARTRQGTQGHRPDTQAAPRPRHPAHNGGRQDRQARTAEDVMRRNEIEMSEAEQADFLSDQRVVICATNGIRGWPHLMPLWYTVRDGHIWCWTYAKSQKTRNLERDPRATL